MAKRATPLRRLERRAKRAVRKLQRQAGLLPPEPPPPPAPFLPFMSDAEFGQQLAVLWAIGAKTVLEWGAGGGTKAVLERCPLIERYVSIEHNATWHDRVADEVDDSRLELHHVAPDRAAPLDAAPQADYWSWAALAEREPAVMASDVAFPRSLDTTFDCVFVDGRGRSYCMTEGYDLLRPGGVLMVHDAQRPAYNAALRDLDGDVIFLPGWSGGQIAIARKPSRPI